MNALAKWGNSLAVRIPAKFAEQSGLKEGTPIEIKAKAGRIVIERARPKYKLKDLLAGYAEDERPLEMWNGKVGDEEW